MTRHTILHTARYRSRHAKPSPLTNIIGESLPRQIAMQLISRWITSSTLDTTRNARWCCMKLNGLGIQTLKTLGSQEKTYFRKSAIYEEHFSELIVRGNCFINLLVHHYLLGLSRKTCPYEVRAVPGKGISSAESIISKETFSMHYDRICQGLQTDWEQEVEEVIEIEFPSNGEPMAVIRMSSGQKCTLSTEWLALHCPRRMLRTYEGIKRITMDFTTVIA